MAKEFTFKGKTLEQLKAMKLEEFIELLTTRKRRTFNRGLKDKHKKFMKTLRESKGPKPIKTHDREMIIIPEMIGRRLAVHNGKEWTVVELQPKSLGHLLGEFAGTRKKVAHSGPGIGATRGTKFVSVK